MVAITRLILLASTVAAATIQLLPRDGYTVIQDITTKIAPQINSLNKQIASFPGSGRAGAEAIAKDTITLIRAVNAATEDVKTARQFDVVQGLQIATEIQAQVPQLLAILVSIAARAHDWGAIEGPKLTLDDLKAGSAAFSNFLDAVIAAEPLLQKPVLITIKVQITGAFNIAIGRFS
ncbi:hypothetical protein ACSS6W_001286 [Trichoderma asperelloides]|nr:hypothetical protein LI328DRAFT_165306 [Trichoderma asperelloides]